jgi:osmotically-inducible protein OsmY
MRRIACDPAKRHACCFSERSMKLLAATLALVTVAGCGGDRSDRHVIDEDPTAGDQKNAPKDLALLGKVRRTLVTDWGLSFRAKNVVLVVSDGVVTVRGSVTSRAEHDMLVARIVSVPGVVRIDDRLDKE